MGLLDGKVMIVTGGNSGTGYESVKEFAGKGAEVILACRNTEKGNNAKKEIIALYPQAKIIIMHLDLMDLASVRNFSDTFRTRYSGLDVLLNNAGIMMVPYGLTKDGFESQMGTNHLGHFALTGLLLDLIIKTPNSRVVNISSNAHKYRKIDFNNFLFENGKIPKNYIHFLKRAFDTHTIDADPFNLDGITHIQRISGDEFEVV